MLAAGNVTRLQLQFRTAANDILRAIYRSGPGQCRPVGDGEGNTSDNICFP